MIVYARLGHVPVIAYMSKLMIDWYVEISGIICSGVLDWRAI